ncbi:hypothetical protein BH10ACI2_BH10ACI2_18000 [soil metagenome]
MRYREIAPPKDLQNVILSYWEFAIPDDAQSPIEAEVFPDGCVSLFYIRNIVRGIHIAGLSGLYLESIARPVFAGDTIWGVRLSPAAATIILRTDASQMVDRSVFEQDSFPHLLIGLATLLQRSKTFEEAVTIFESRLRDVMLGVDGLDDEVAEAVRTIDERFGEIRVGELAKTLGLSTRQFQRRFKASSGLSPKQYIRARRIRAVAVHLVEREGYNLADRAAEFGFADQSHMSHEFSVVTKRSPNSFARNVAKIDHGNLVK